MTDRHLPDELMIALLAYQDDPSWLPPQGSPGLRAMLKVEGEPHDRDFEWVDEQHELQKKALALYQEMVVAAPPPTTKQILSGNPVEYPDWIGTPWSETLMSPWSQNLYDAIESAEEYLDTKTRAKA